MSTNKSKIVLKMLKELGTLWHSQSTLVFKSPTEKKVTGRFENGEFIELDDTALELIEEWGFKVDQETFDRLYKDNGSAGDENGSAGEDKEGEDKKVDSEDDVDDIVQNKPLEVEDQIRIEKVDTEVVKPEVVKPISKEKVVIKGSANAEVKSKIDVKTILSSFYEKFVETGLSELVISHQAEVDCLESRLAKTEEELDNTKEELAQKQNDFKELSEKYDAIKKKFDTMKSIFS
jgi:hypothetical protein